VIYLVDWGSAVRIFGTALPCEILFSFWQHSSGSAPACQQPSCHLYIPILNPKMSHSHWFAVRFACVTLPGKLQLMGSANCKSITSKTGGSILFGSRGVAGGKQ